MSKKIIALIMAIVGLIILFVIDYRIAIAIMLYMGANRLDK